MGAFWGLLASLAIGASDLYGRRAMARSHALTAALAMQVVAALAALVATFVVASQLLVTDMAWGAASGLGLAGGLGCYYLGLERSSAGIVAPLVGTLSAVIPFCYALMRGSESSALAIGGAALAFCGLAVISLGDRAAEDIRRGLCWGAISGLFYGFGMCMAIEVSDASGSWPAVSQRVSAALALLLAAFATQARLVPPLGARADAVFAGVLLAAMSVFVLLGFAADATQAVVTSSMFPAVSVIVGVAFFGESFDRRQGAGLVLVLIGVATVVGT